LATPSALRPTAKRRYTGRMKDAFPSEGPPAAATVAADVPGAPPGPSPESPAPLLSADGLVKCFGPVRALDGVSLRLHAGEGDLYRV
jgi:hypothetical protein